MPGTKRLSRYARIHSKSRILLVLDARSQLWGFPGGTPEEREGGEQTLYRELCEEVGPVSGLSAVFYHTETRGEKIIEYWKVRCSVRVHIREIDREVVSAKFYSLAALKALPLCHVAPGVTAMASDVLEFGH